MSHRRSLLDPLTDINEYDSDSGSSIENSDYKNIFDSSDSENFLSSEERNNNDIFENEKGM